MPKSKRRKFILFISSGIFVFIALFIFSKSINAQGPNLWGNNNEVKNTIETETNLSGQDIRLTIVNIIRVVLGFLGIIAVILLIYAGFLWMTAQGNEDKILRAKKIMVNGAIGLLIILSSYAIASFVIKLINDSIGGNIGNIAGCVENETNICDCGCGTSVCQENKFGLCSSNSCCGGKDNFYVKSTVPADSKTNVIRNVKVRYYFSKNVNDATVNNNNFKLTYVDAEVVQTINGQRNIDGNVIEFIPDSVCPDNPCGAKKCFPENKEITVKAVGEPNGILSLGDGLKLDCGFVGKKCEIKFTTGSLIDCEDPKVSLILDNQMCVDKKHNLGANGSDDSGIASIKFYANTNKIAEAANTDGDNPFNVPLGSVVWDSAGFKPGDAVNLEAAAYDLDEHSANDKKTIILKPAHCCNGIKDEDEESIDCGGSCAACQGAACGKSMSVACASGADSNCDDSRCSTGFCNCGSYLDGPDANDSCQEKGYEQGVGNSCCACELKPIIQSISPNDGASGNLITIHGKNFGNVSKIFENVLSNVDFEQGNEGDVPAGWMSGHQRHSMVSITKEEHRSGNKSIKIHQDPNQSYPGKCSKDLCLDTSGCTWLDAVKQCKFNGSDDCHSPGPSIYDEGQDFCWGNSRRVDWLKLVYNVAPLKWQPGEKYIMKFYYKGHNEDTIRIKLSFGLGWDNQCGSFKISWGKDSCDEVNGPADGYPTCAEQPGYCCVNAPFQKKCYIPKSFSAIPLGNYNDWRLFSAIFTYTEEMSRFFDSNGKLRNEIGLEMGYNITGLSGTNFYIDDFTIAKVPSKGGVVFLGTPDENDDLFGIFPSDLNSVCGSSWQDEQIIIAVPDGAADGPIKVIAENGFSDRTDDNSGPKISNFDANAIKRPGLCTAYNDQKKNEGEPKQPITLAGLNLINVDTKEEIMFGNELNGFPAYSGPIPVPDDKKNILLEGVAIPTVKQGMASVYVVDNTEKSNPLDFKILGSILNPEIISFDPKAGHSGDYITIYGHGFGDAKGQVWFNFSPKIEADYSFPQECLTSVWKDNMVIVKVPKNAPEGIVKFTIKNHINGLEAESSENFYAGDYCSKDYKLCPSDATTCGSFNRGICVTSARPGLCKINPNNGHSGTEVSFWGENFGSAQGKARFNIEGGTSDVAPSQWTNGAGLNADSARASVPQKTLNGPIKIVNTQNLESNGIQFKITDCKDDNECPDGFCCGPNSYFAGSCIAKSGNLPKEAICVKSEKAPGEYKWSFSTELKSSRGCENITEANKNQCVEPDCCWDTDNTCKENGFCVQNIPHIVEKCDQTSTCKENAGGPSPSPWISHNGGDKACVDSIIRADFTMDMNQNTFNSASGNIIVEQCSAEDCKNIVSAVQGTITTAATSFTFIPNAYFSKNTWYQITLKDSILSSSGIKLDGNNDGKPGGNYKWKFKTKDDDNICKIGCVSVNPSYYRALTSNSILYSGNFSAEDNVCLLLKPRGEIWNWTSSEPLKALIDLNNDSCNCVGTNCKCVNPLKETGANPVIITGKVAADGKEKQGIGKLEIDFPDLKVIDQWPNCEAACLNADVGLKFNSEVSAPSIEINSNKDVLNLKIYQCSSKDCITPEAFSSGGNSNGDVITLVHLPFSRDTYYRVVIKGGDDGIKNISGGLLSNLNYNTGSKNKAPNPSFEEAGDVNHPARFWSYNPDLNEAQKGKISRVNNQERVKFGDYSLEFRPLNEELGVNSSIDIHINAGKYILSGWVYNSLIKGKAYLDLSGINTECNVKTLSKNWGKGEDVKCEFTAGTGKNVRIHLKVTADDNESLPEGSVWFDDIKLIEVDGLRNAYSWIFKTGDKECAVNKIEISPKEGIVNQIGDSLMYSATPFSTSDSCNSNGQKLNALSYNWMWSKNPSDSPIAGISSYPDCGNGVIERGEDCDDRNKTANDGCNSICQNEGSNADCGNGIIGKGEDCDDKDKDNGDGCSSVCQNEGSDTLYGSNCGNGILEIGEDCDDSNKDDSDGCSAKCLNEGTWKGRVAPYQSVTALDGPSIGQNSASVKIIAQETSTGKSGSGDFSISCGYRYGVDDNKCNLENSNVRGVGNNGCCYLRPTILEPENNLNDFCLNGLVKVRFSQVMDENILKEAKILKRYNGECNCATEFFDGTGCKPLSLGMGNGMPRIAGAFHIQEKKSIWSNIRLLIEKIIFFPIHNIVSVSTWLSSRGEYNKIVMIKDKGIVSFAKSLFGIAKADVEPSWCPVEQSITTREEVYVYQDQDKTKSTTTVAIIKPKDLLQAHFAGGNFDYRLDFTGLKNKAGVSMINNTFRDIKTGLELCKIDHIDVLIEPTSPRKPTHYDRFTCAERNDCEGDANNTAAGNQHKYIPEAKDGVGRLLQANYVWLENDPKNSIAISHDKFDWVTANRAQGDEASIEIGGYASYPDIAYNSSATSTVQLKIFMCENPWPAISSFPYNDPDYNFSLFYCRDTVNKDEPLPDFGNLDPVCSDNPKCQSDSQKEYLWVEGSSHIQAEDIKTASCDNPGRCNGNCPSACNVSQDPDCGCLNNDGCCGINCTNIKDNDCKPLCGNKACDIGEDCFTCSADCGECPNTCGDGFCDVGCGECANCPTDCALSAGC